MILLYFVVKQTWWTWYQRVCFETDWRFWDLYVCMPWDCCKCILLMTAGCLPDSPKLDSPKPNSPKPDLPKKSYSVSSITVLVWTFCYCNSEQSQHS